MLLNEQIVRDKKLEIISERIISFLNENKIKNINDLENILSENFYIKNYENKDFIFIRKDSNQDLLSDSEKYGHNYRDQNNRRNNPDENFLLFYNLYLEDTLYKIPLEVEIKNNLIKIIIKCYYSVKDYKLCAVDFFNNKIQVKELKTNKLSALKRELKNLTSEEVYQF